LTPSAWTGNLCGKTTVSDAPSDMNTVNDPLAESATRLLAIPKLLGTIGPQEGFPGAGSMQGYEAGSRFYAYLDRLEALGLPACLYDDAGARIAFDAAHDGFPDRVTDEAKARVSVCFGEHDGGLFLFSQACADRHAAPDGVGWLAFHIDRSFVEIALARFGQPVSLTANEFRLVANLLAGRDLKEAALNSGASYETRRKQLQVIFHKLDVNSQSGLVRTVSLGLIGCLLDRLSEARVERDPEQELLRRHYGDEALLHTFALRSGRRLQVWEFGPRDGIPCLFFHQMLAPTVLAPDKVSELHAHGVRWITVPRFFWEAGPTETGQMAADYADDLAEVVEMMFPGPVTCVAVNTGVAWAAFFATRHPHLARRLVLVGSPFPKAPGETAAKPSSLQHAFANVMRTQPAALNVVMRSYLRLTRSKRLSALAMRHTYREPGPDQTALESLLEKGWMQDWIELIGERAGDRIAADLALNQWDWISALEKYNGGVDFIHGDTDRMVPPHLIEEAAERIGQAKLIMVPDAGHLISAYRFDAVLAHVRSDIGAYNPA